MSPVAMGLLLSTAAGLATTLGALVAYAVRRPSRPFIGMALGFAAGVMLFVAFLQLVANGIKVLGFGRGALA